MIVVHGETYKIELAKRVENSPYEYEENYISFMCRPANQMEKRNYRVQQGVNGDNLSVFIISSNLPDDINVGDKVRFLGKEWVVASIGYYFDATRLTNAKIMSDDYILSHAPRGINIQ